VRLTPLDREFQPQIMCAATRKDCSRLIDDLAKNLQDITNELNKIKGSKRNKALEEIEWKWNKLVKYCPSLDIRIHLDSDIDLQSEYPEIITKWKYDADGT
jgi:hypothetical protein